MPKDWDWYSDDCKESTVVPAVQAIAVYTNNNGDVVLRQQDSMGGEDSLIIVPQSYARTIAQSILSQLDA